MSLTLALLSVQTKPEKKKTKKQKKPEDANPLRKMGLHKSDLSYSNKISQHFNDCFFV